MELLKQRRFRKGWKQWYEGFEKLKQPIPQSILQTLFKKIKSLANNKNQNTMSLEYEKIEQIVLLFWDEQENFDHESTRRKIGTLFKDLHRIDSLDSFKQAIGKYPEPTQQFLCLVHLSHSNDNKGYYDFKNSKVLKEFPGLNYYCITSARLNKVYDKKNNNAEIPYVYTYDGYQELVFNTFHPQSKKQMNSPSANTSASIETSVHPDYIKCEYAILTALEEDEMEKVLPMITKVGQVPNKKHLIEYGFVASKPEKRIAYASQQATGMIDAAILATELITLFRPKFLIMAGVLGGKPKEVKIGDVVIATKVFTIDKGKIDQYGFKSELEASGNESAAITKLRRIKTEFVNYIRKKDETRKSNVEVHFGPIACVRQVIDLKDFFEDKITSVDRKALALEMESYGVSRACELVNDGRTEALIIKSAMDNTIEKTDHAKTYAAWTSAAFVQYILENDVI